VSGGVLIMATQESPPSRIAALGSSYVLYLTIASIVLGLLLSRTAGVPKAVALWLIFAVWPVGAVVAAVWSAVNGIRSPNARYGIEFILAIGCSAAFIWLVAQPK
jgi:hypothetical protein